MIIKGYSVFLNKYLLKLNRDNLKKLSEIYSFLEVHLITSGMSRARYYMHF